MKKIALFVYNHVDALIVVSPTLQSKIENDFHIPSVIIPNIVDLSIFKYQETTQRSENFTFISVGNLITLKRMDLLIIAFSLFVKKNANSELVIFGNGPERKNLAKLIVDLGLENKIVLRGQCSRNEIAISLNRASCFVLPSSSETFGVAYIEALACGVPVIATRCGGPEGFVHESNGVLVPVDDQASLVAAMDDMYHNLKRFTRKQIAIEITDKFSPKSVASQLEKIYIKLKS